MASIEATRRILEEQLRLVLEQKVLLENHLADLNTQPQPSALLPQKRSAPLGAASKQPSKRQRVRSKPLWRSSPPSPCQAFCMRFICLS